MFVESNHNSGFAAELRKRVAEIEERERLNRTLNAVYDAGMIDYHDYCYLYRKFGLVRIHW